MKITLFRSAVPGDPRLTVPVEIVDAEAENEQELRSAQLAELRRLLHAEADT